MNDNSGDGATILSGYVLIAVLVASVELRAAAAVSTWLIGESFDGSDTAASLVALLNGPGDPASAWGSPMAGPFVYWLIFAVLFAFSVWLAVVVRRLLRRSVVGFDVRDRLGTSPEAEFASRGDLRTLHVECEVGDRLVLGTIGRNQLLATENQSSAYDVGPERGRWADQRNDRGAVMCVGPSRSGKTVGIVSGMLRWRGPIIAVSVKGDLLGPTLLHRRGCGEVAVFDPTERLRQSFRPQSESSIRRLEPPAGWDERLCVNWSPLAKVGCFEDAQRVAAALTDSAPRPNGGEGKDFWIARAEMILGPLIWLAAVNGCPFSMVVHWAMERPQPPGDDVGSDEWIYQGFFDRAASDGSPEVRSELPIVRNVLYGQLVLHEKTVDSTFATLQTVVQPWMTPVVGESAAGGTGSVDLEWLLSASDGKHNTFYLSAPPDEFKRLGPVYGGAIDELLRDVYRYVEVTGAPISPPLLVVLDEIANMPMKMLPEYVSTLAGLGVQLVTVWQDFGQIFAAYGSDLGDTLISNHMSKLFFRGIFSRATLQYLNDNAGHEEVHATGQTLDLWSSRKGSTNEVAQRVSLIPPNVVRELPVGDALLIHGGLRPAHISSLRWFNDAKLLELTKAPLESAVQGLPNVGVSSALDDSNIEQTTQIATPTVHPPSPHSNALAGRKRPSAASSRGLFQRALEQEREQ